MRKLKTYDNGGPKVKQRRGVRKNYGNQTWTPSGLQFPTCVSSHLMTTEYIPGRGWVSFPSLFQDSKPYADDQQNWVDMSGEEDWMKIYEEAERRGEVYDFGEDKEAALAFGEGSWKDEIIQSPEAWEQEISRMERKLGNPRGWTMDDYHMMQDKLNEYKAWRERHPEVIDHSNKPNEYVVPLPPHLNADQYIEVELTPEEIEQYVKGGYIVEELPKAQKGTVDPSKMKRRTSLLDKYNIDPALTLPKPEVAESTKPKNYIPSKSSAANAVKETKQARDVGAQMIMENPSLSDEQKYEMYNNLLKFAYLNHKLYVLTPSLKTHNIPYIPI